MEENIRNLPEDTDAIDDSFGVVRDVDAPGRRTELPRAVPMSALLAADSGHDIDFEPERLCRNTRPHEQ